MLNSRFGYSVKKNSFKGLNIDCIQYSNIIRITYYSYSYSGTILNPNIIRIRIRPNICARILFVFVFAHSEKTNIIRIRIRSKFWFRILFVFVFGPKNSIRSPLVCTSARNYQLNLHWLLQVNAKRKRHRPLKKENTQLCRMPEVIWLTRNSEEAYGDPQQGKDI